MIQDDSQGPSLTNLQNNQQPQQGNSLGSLVQNAPQQAKISKPQLIAGLHHLSSFANAMQPVLRSPDLGKSNIRPKLFDALAHLIGSQIFTVPEVMNGIKDLPNDPIQQKKWLEQKMMQVAQAEQKIVSDYVAQGPGAENPVEWTQDTHRDHMTGLMGNY